MTFLGSRQDYQYGSRGTVAKDLGTGAFYGTKFLATADIVNNTIYKFGKDNQQSFQFFYENQRNDFYGNYGGIGGMSYVQGDQFDQHYLPLYSFLNSYQWGQLTERLPGQPQPTLLASCTGPGSAADAGYGQAGFNSPCYSAPLDRGPINYFQPNDVMKLQYSNNLDASTFFTLKAYKTNSVVTFDFPFDERSVGLSELLPEAGRRTLRPRARLDQAAELQEPPAVRREVRVPAPDLRSGRPRRRRSFAETAFSPGYEAGDFLNPNSAWCPSSPSAASAAATCGRTSRARGTKLGVDGPGPIPA